MDLIAAQPSAPAATRQSTSRIGNLFKPLRKAASAKDLNKVASYEYYKSTTPLPLLNTNTSPLDDSWQSASQSPVQPPPISFGFTSNKARITRALGETSRGESHWAGDADYIPYRGPISPPSSSVAFPSSQQQQITEKSAERRLPIQSHQSGLTGLEGAFSARPATNLGGEQTEREATTSIPRYKGLPSIPSGLGLETLDAIPPEGSTSGGKGRYMIDRGLPSAYTHGGNAPSQGSGGVARSVANQLYMPSLLRFDADADRGHLKQSREVQIRQSTSASTRVPVNAPSPLIKHSFTQDRPSHNSKATSLSSSDGHHSSLVNEESRSTSMTSLRDQASLHGSKIRRSSQEGPPPSASAKSRSKPSSSNPTIGGSTVPQQSEPIISHGKTDSSSTATTSFTSAPSTSFTPVVAHDFVPKGSTLPNSENVKEEEKIGQNLKGEVMAAPHLSTIQSSSTDHRPSRSTVHLSATDWVEHQERQEMTTPMRREDAHQKYLLLQQLHLDEMKSHAPDQDGWLEPNNGCERVLMPKPLLRSKRAESESRSSNGMTFERNRRGQQLGNEESDAANAQAIFSGEEYSSTARLTRGRDVTPAFFHHRMPPATPNLESRGDATRTSSIRPAQVIIPPRRSSQSRRNRAETTTPALTFHNASDDDDNDSIPDLATVLAQGRALDAERERWRQQYHRSLIKATGGRSKSRESTVKKVRYNVEPLPNLSFLQDDTITATGKTPIRQAKSTPDLRKSMSRGAYQDSSNVGIGALCIAPFRDPSSKPQNNQQQRQLRQRSKSQEGLSSSLISSICLPLRSRRRRATTLISEEEKSREPNMSKSATTTHASAVQEEPIVISRAAALKGWNTTAVEAGSSDAFRFPNTRNYTNTRPIETNYGIAFSAPRPDIGKTVPKAETFAAGRHATTRKYHIPSSSDDLRVMLASSSRQSQEHQRQSELKGKKTDLTARSATGRGDSLGMSHVLQSIDDRKLATEVAKRGPKPAYEATSLPVPPRKNRSYQNSPASINVDLHPPTVKMEDFSTTNTSIGTPTLGRMAHRTQEGAFPQKDRLEVETRRRDGNQSVGPSQHRKVVDKAISRQSKDNNARLTVHSTSSSSDSGYSPRSVAARELWNTDEHPEEAFQGLFVRRPGAGTSSRKSLTASNVGPSSSRDVEHALGRDSRTRDSLYRASLDSKRDSAHIEMLVGSYLNTLSVPGQTDEHLEKSIVQDSDIDLDRKGIRFGRIGGRTPVISPAFHSANEESDDEIEDSGVKSGRARMDSFAASLVLASEGNSPNVQEHPQAPLETVSAISQEKSDSEQVVAKQTEDRFSDESLANMVRDFVWPDPPTDKGEAE